MLQTELRGHRQRRALKVLHCRQHNFLLHADVPQKRPAETVINLGVNLIVCADRAR